jgi:hypothetical protein
MISPVSNEFSTNHAWFRAVVGRKDLILRRTSALECLELFGGYMHEKAIDVYARRQGEYENVNYHIVDSFGDIDYIQLDDVMCATANHTFNEMLANYDNMEETIDEQALIEGLSDYYFSHNESFDGLEIEPGNLARFNEIKEWAIEYHRFG